MHARLVADPSVSELLAVPEAYTPVLKFVMRGVHIDMLFACMSAHKVLTPHTPPYITIYHNATPCTTMHHRTVMHNIASVHHSA